MKEMEDVSPEEKKKGMEPWMHWAEKCGDGLVDMGSPLGNGQKITSDGASATDHAEVAGYSILQAESMDKAKEMLTEHPHLDWVDGCEINVFEMMPLDM
jgi:hypothetical protein